MGVTIATMRQACSTGTGNQDFTTVDCGSLTPAASLFILPHAITDGTPNNGVVFCVGAVTGASERWSQSTASYHNVADTDTTRRGITDGCVYKQFQGGAIDGEADLNSFITNGVRINWSDAPGAAYLMNPVFFCGSDVSAYAGTFNPHSTQDNYVDVTAAGFEPDLLILFTLACPYDDNEYAGIWDSWGVAANDGSETQRCTLYHSVDSAANQQVHSYFSETRAGGQIASGGGSLQYTLEIDSFLASGFRAYTRDGTPSGTDDVGYLALNFNSAVGVWVGTVTTPAGTGSDSVTGVGFKPQFWMEALTHMPAVATHYSNASAGSRGMSVVTSGAQYCSSVQEEDASDPTDTQSTSDGQYIFIEEDDGSPGHEATFTSFDSDGMTRNFTVNAVGAVKSWACAVEEYAAGGNAMPMAMDQYYRRR